MIRWNSRLAGWACGCLVFGSLMPPMVQADFPKLPTVDPVEIFQRDSLRPDQQRYYRDGFLYYLGPLEGTLAQGLGRLFWRNGKVRYEGQFVQGRFEGEGKLFDHEGRLLFEGIFRAGVFAQGAYYDAAGELMYEGDFPPPPLLQQ